LPFPTLKRDILIGAYKTHNGGTLMANGNTIEIIGNVTGDPELRQTPGGANVVSFGVAYNRKWQNRQTQEWEEAVSFYDVEAWQDLAVNVADSLTKGMRVVVTGRLDQKSWETADGDKRSKHVIVADDVAVSLRYATVDGVTKNERSEDGGSAPKKSSGGKKASKPQYDNEEPF
jgi:single-strand DNA-binding protein